MKKSLVIFSLLAMFSCKNEHKEHKKESKQSVEQNLESAHEHHEDHLDTAYQNDWVANMQLDNDNKWQANNETNEGVLKMQNILKSYETNSLEEYHSLATELNEVKNYVVKECTMTGPSHDNLHVWLHPLIEKIEKLLNAESLDDAAKLKLSIQENIAAYYTYFK